MYHPPHPETYRAKLRAFLLEDWGTQDWTTAAVPDRPMTARVVAKEELVLAGLPVAAEVLRLADPALEVALLAADGQRMSKGAEVLRVEGSSHGILLAERVMLNLLQRLSGTATLTRQFVDAISGTGARLLDTRKTTPGLKLLEKYAVRCGGGVNHRMSLSDAALVKDNHVLAAGGVRAAFQAVRATFPGLSVEVECDTVEQVGEAVAAGADLVLLDNMGLAELRRSVEVAAGRAGLEASGGLTLDMAYAVAATGVDYLAIGALTHSAPALDIGVDLRSG